MRFMRFMRFMIFIIIKKLEMVLLQYVRTPSFAAVTTTESLYTILPSSREGIRVRL